MQPLQEMFLASSGSGWECNTVTSAPEPRASWKGGLWGAGSSALKENLLPLLSAAVRGLQVVQGLCLVCKVKWDFYKKKFSQFLSSAKPVHLGPVAILDTGTEPGKEVASSSNCASL